MSKTDFHIEYDYRVGESGVRDVLLHTHSSLDLGSRVLSLDIRENQRESKKQKQLISSSGHPGSARQAPAKDLLLLIILGPAITCLDSGFMVN